MLSLLTQAGIPGRRQLTRSKTCHGSQVTSRGGNRVLRLGRIGTGFRPRYFLPKELTGERIVREPTEARFQCLHRGELIVSFEDLAVERIAQRPLEPELAEEDRSEERRVGKECRSRWS